MAIVMCPCAIVLILLLVKWRVCDITRVPLYNPAYNNHAEVLMRWTAAGFKWERERDPKRKESLQNPSWHRCSAVSLQTIFNIYLIGTDQASPTRSQTPALQWGRGGPFNYSSCLNLFRIFRSYVPIVATQHPFPALFFIWSLSPDVCVLALLQTAASAARWYFSLYVGLL